MTMTNTWSTAVAGRAVAVGGSVRPAVGADVLAGVEAGVIVGVWPGLFVAVATGDGGDVPGPRRITAMTMAAAARTMMADGRATARPRKTRVFRIIDETTSAVT